MTEIKFRAWDKKNKTMSKCFTLQEWIRLSAEASYCVVKAEGLTNDIKDKKDFWCKEDRLFLQYTGLKDKNGKEIYEGDIIRGDYSICPVGFDNGSFNWNGECLGDYNLENIEIIGNIWENPELKGSE